MFCPRQVYTTFLEYVFPLFCLGCKKEGEWVCMTCYGSLLQTGVFCCPICHANQPLGKPCSSCIDQSYLSSHIAIMPYREDELIGEIIRTVKYHYVEELFGIFEKIMQEFFHERSGFFLGIDGIIPVPLHKRRLAERGFNQAENIASMISTFSQIPLVRPLYRSRHTKHQARLAKQERHTNVKDAFFVKENIQGKIFLLVDDVYTTGSTMQECAKALRAAGAAAVFGFTIARG